MSLGQVQILKLLMCEPHRWHTFEARNRKSVYALRAHDLIDSRRVPTGHGGYESQIRLKVPHAP